MIASIFYVFLVYFNIECTAADGSEKQQLHNAANQTRISLLRENVDTYQHNTNKECVLIVNETDLFFLQQLVQNKVVHVVGLDLQFLSNTSNSMIKGWRWYVTNNVGREILSVLAMNDWFVTWTLNVGIKTMKVRVFDKPPGCATTGQEQGDFIAGAMLKQLSFVDEKEMCFDKVSNKSTQTRCCKIFGKDRLKYCYVSVGRSEFVKILESMLSLWRHCLTFMWLYVVVLYGQILQWRNTNNTVQRQGYYKLTECPMSTSSILCTFIWDGYGRFISFVRRCLLILVMFLVFWQIKFFSDVAVLCFLLWAVFYPFSRLFELEDSLPDEYIRNQSARLLLKLFSYFGHDIDDVYLSARINVLGGISLITLPFNVERWKKSLAKVYHKIIASSTLGSFLKYKILLFSITGVFCLGYILFIFIIQVIVVLSFILDSFVTVFERQVLIIILRKSYITCWIPRILVIVICDFACVFYTNMCFIVIFVLTPYIVIPLVSGLILNVVFFSPYIVCISMLTFYSCMFWASVEQQHAVLMRLIFDQNINNNSYSDSSNNNDNSIMNNSGGNASVGAAEVNQENIEIVNTVDTDHVSRDNETGENNSVVDIDGPVVTEIVCVVPKELYDKIREQLLPYHRSLFGFVLKVLGILILSCLTLTLVYTLQANGISSTVQALMALSVSALPYILDVFAAKKSEDEKDAWKEQLKHRVKPLVDKFTANNSELCRIKLVIRHHPLYSNVEDARVQERAV